MFQRFQSPLLGTALILVSMAAIAVPLDRLTSKSQPSPEPGPVVGREVGTTIPGYLRITTLDPLRSLRVLTLDGETIASLENPEPGEHEVEAELPWENRSIDLTVMALGGEKSTAIFVTAMPDRYEERTAYAIGSGQIREELRFEWEQE